MYRSIHLQTRAFERTQAIFDTDFFGVVRMTRSKCEGENKNAPVVGLEVFSRMTREGKEYVGGRILDPDNGKVYRGKVRLTDNGKKLSVHGYIGVPMLGRSQTWVRQE